MSGDPQKSRRRGWRIAILAILLLGAFVVLGAPMVACGGPGARNAALRNACINNLRQIDGAKEQWALEFQKQPGDPTVEEVIGSYIEGGFPKCPVGGKYTIGAVDEEPRCSIERHAPPSQPK